MAKRIQWVTFGVLSTLIVLLGANNYSLRTRLDELQKLVETRDESPPAAKPRVDTDSSGFHDLSLANALDRAGSQGKTVMAFYYVNESGPSMEMERNTWNSPDVQTWLRDKTIAIKIDADRKANLAVANKIDRLPVMVFLNANGGEVGRLIGYQPPSAFIREATAIIQNAGK